MTLKSEEDFNSWMEGISFVDEDGEAVPIILTPDTTEDPEGDREGVK